MVFQSIETPNTHISSNSPNSNEAIFRLSFCFLPVLCFLSTLSTAPFTSTACVCVRIHFWTLIIDHQAFLQSTSHRTGTLGVSVPHSHSLTHHYYQKGLIHQLVERECKGEVSSFVCARAKSVWIHTLTHRDRQTGLLRCFLLRGWSNTKGRK